MDLISAIGAINALIIAFLVYHKKNKNISDKILLAWILNFTLHFAILFFIERNVSIHRANWGTILGIVLVLHAPFLFIYTRSLTDRHFTVNLKTLSHFGVIFLYVIASVPIILLGPEEHLNMVYGREGIPYQAFLPMFTLLLCQIYFLIRTIIILLKHQYNIKREFLYEEKINLVWIRHIVYGFALIIVFSFIAYALVSTKIISIYLMDSVVTYANMALFFYIAYYGYKQRSVYRPDQVIKTVSAEATKKERKTTSGIVKQVHLEIETLEEIMKKEKPYLDPELNIGNLANHMDIHAHQLSKIINTVLDKNFFEFVNEYRVEEFKRLVANPENKHISILGLAIDAGFNSKATFNGFFKNSTGLTPSEFRESFKF